jgi:uncharacterized protein (TIGR04255 family)
VTQKGKRYKTPPITEAVCEIKLTPDSKVDFTVPGLLYEKLKGEFPLKEKGSLVIGGDHTLTELAVFLTKDKNTSIRVGCKLPILSIIRQKPYPSWNQFKPQIDKAYNAFKTVEGDDIQGIQRIGLLYVNLIEIPEKSVNLGDYFEYGLNLGGRLPREVRAFLVGSDFSFFEGRDVCRVQLASAVASNPEHFNVRLDLDYYLAKPQAVSPDGVSEWVENAHQKVEELFEACIKDRARELFGGVQ